MSSTPDSPEPAPPALPARVLAGVRDSMSAQIALVIALVTALLMLIGCWTIGRLLEQEFSELQLFVPKSQREAFVDRAWRVVFWTLAAGAAAAGVLAWWITQRILAPTRRLGDTANRISADALDERLPVQDTPAELAPVAEAFNHMLDRLQGAFDRLSAFSSDLAHDLRAPIHRLLTATQVTLAQPRTAEAYRTVLESAVVDYERIGRLIDNILFLARADHTQALLQPRWWPLHKRLGDMAEFFEVLADDRGLQLRLDVDTLVNVWADDVLLARAVGNLLTNALRHARAGSIVTLSGHRLSPGAVRIAVANEGEPIAPDQQAAIFARRYRLEDPQAPAATGSGLGLAIVKTVMDLHGGSVEVRSGPGLPTMFTLDFPGPARRRVDLRPAARRSAP